MKGKIEPTNDNENNYNDVTTEVAEKVQTKTGKVVKSNPVMSRIVRLEPNPGKRATLKLKMSQAKVNSAGQAIQDREGNIVKVETDAPDMIQVPGTTRDLRAPLTATGLLTGLNYIIDNPYRDLPSYNPAWGEKIFQGRDKVLLQHALEYKHGKDFDYYTNRLFDRIYPSDKLAEIPFFATPQSRVPMTGNVMFLDLNNPLHEVWYYILRVHPEIANSYAELKEKPEAWYYMVDEIEVGKIRTDIKRRNNTAAAAIEEVYKLSDDSIIKWAKALEIESRNPTKDTAYEFLDNYFRRGDIQYANFTKYYDMFKDAARRARFYAAADVHDYVQASIIRERDNKYYWIKPGTDTSPIQTFEWKSKDDLITNFILAPEYTDEVMLMRSIFEARK